MTTRSFMLTWLAALLAALVVATRAFQVRAERFAAEAQVAAQERKLDRSRANLAAAARLAERLEARAAGALPELSAEEKAVEALRGKLSASIARHAREPLGPPLLDPFTDAAERTAREPLTNADYTARYRLSNRVRMEQQYNEILYALPIPEEIRTKLLDLLVDRILARLDLMAVTGANRWGPTNLPTEAQRAQVTAAQKLQDQKFRGELQELLGESYLPFENFEKSTTARYEIGKLPDRLSYGDHPLQPPQFAALVSLVDPARKGGFARDIDDAFETAAAAILDPEQRNALHELRAEQRTISAR